MKSLDFTPLISSLVLGALSIVVSLLNYFFPNSMNGTYLKLLF